MKALLTIAAVLCVPACSYAQGAAAPATPAVAKPCEDLKTEIAAKLDGKGVKGYSLEVVAKDQEVADGKAVGTCEGGTKKIVYRKGGAAATASAAKDPTKQ